MKPAVSVIALWLACGLGAADADPLRSPACRVALVALSSAEDAAIASRTADADARLRTARRAVVRDCLGAAADIGPPPARARAPVAVDSTLPPRAATAPEAPARPGAPALRMRPLLTITGCDAAGCWASDGSRLQRQGTLLLGPRGTCSELGGVLNCP